MFRHTALLVFVIYLVGVQSAFVANLKESTAIEQNSSQERNSDVPDFDASIGTAWTSSGSGSGSESNPEPAQTEKNDAENIAQIVTSAPSPRPQFNSLSAELEWKFNKARASLRKAKQYVALSELIHEKKHTGTKNEKEVKKIINNTEFALVHAGEKMGLDYKHYKRSVDDDEYE